MFRRLPSPAQLEDEVLAYWDEQDIFAKSLEASKNKPTFVFYEGPPTANGLPHNGHVLTRVMKDIIPRYKTMRGFRVDRKAGWDTHGLPVEVEVEKNLGIKGRQAIEDYGLESFNRKCMDSVFTYIDEWEQLTKQVGFWVDTENAYATFHRTYVESVWWALSRLFDKGLLYKGHKVVWWWPQGGTTLSAAEVGWGYKQVDDPAVTVRFRDADDPTVSYLAWTTTPWTLPSNVALAVGHKIDYAYCDDPDGGTVVVAVALAESFGLEPKRVVKGTELLGKRYTPLFDFGAPEGGDAFVIVQADHVTTGAGTGIVHTAPAFGEDDMVVARKQKLGVLQWLEPDGTFPAGTGYLEGVFCKEADKAIIADLRERGHMFKRETYRHDYPFCWRADSDPLIQYARPAWFVRTTDRVREALANNDQVNWHPEHIQQGRFGDFLRNNVDWALSRERFWGTPLNIWECPLCEARKCPASVAEIERLSPGSLDPTVDEHLQVHRPWIDRVTLPCDCGGTMARVTEVIDCWFDAGSMPFAQWGFPHQNAEAFKQQFPADFICEAIDQTRGWFYSLLMISTLIFDDETCKELGVTAPGYPRPYKNCVVLGHVCDMDGKKESKSKGNYTSPNLVLRGRTRLFVVADDTLDRGSVGLKKAQIRSLELPGKARITLSAAEEPDERAVQAQVVAANVVPKDTVHVHPVDLKAMGVPLVDGTLWFRVPGEAPGGDAFRWLFCASNPPSSKTRLSMRTIREGQREFLIRLRNVYQFFGIYAEIAHNNGQFDPAGQAPRPGSERSELDRWILHRLQDTTTLVTEHLEGYRTYDASRALLRFVDELSNWYVRRSRSRFWGEGAELEDALWTLYEVLIAISKLIAPFVPFTAEALYRSLVVSARPSAPQSVHLADWPQADASLLNPELDQSMQLVRSLTSLGLAARGASKVKVRQPLSQATVVLADPSRQAGVEALMEQMRVELNVRSIDFAADAASIVSFQVKPDFKRLGKRLGKDMKRVAQALGKMDGQQAKAQLDAGGITVTLDGLDIVLTADDCVIRVNAKGDYEASSNADGVVALNTLIDDDLAAEGFVRELTNRVQTLRKELDLGFTQRIDVAIDGAPFVHDAMGRFGAHLAHETLTVNLSLGQTQARDGWERREWDVDGHAVSGLVRPH